MKGASFTLIRVCFIQELIGTQECNSMTCYWESSTYYSLWCSDVKDLALRVLRGIDL